MVLLNGSALAINWEQENLDAILETWYGGEKGGEALADVLIGKYNPAGRLPLSFYKTRILIGVTGIIGNHWTVITGVSKDKSSYHIFDSGPTLR